jgi:hypothetical protein
MFLADQLARFPDHHDPTFDHVLEFTVGHDLYCSVIPEGALKVNSA